MCTPSGARCNLSLEWGHLLAAVIARMWNSGVVAGLDVETQSHVDQAVLVLHGELDMETRFSLHEVAVEQLTAPGLTKLRMDLGDVTFLDSSGVSALVELRKEANDRGIEMEISSVSRPAARILTIVGLAETFGIPADVATSRTQAADTDS